MAFQRAIDSGHPEWAPAAANSLGVLLATAQDPPDVAGARAVYQRAIDSGHSEWAPAAAYNLGVLLAAQDPPDVAGARAAYQRAIDSGNTEQAPMAIPIRTPTRPSACLLITGAEAGCNPDAVSGLRRGCRGLLEGDDPGVIVRKPRD
ncbi:MAG TPA: hypothetical protein VE673_10690 [Pseudonocardiaceae bacterium]|nr:hypothetical protein [Pseudonocardiaceae bacterium]